MPEQTLTGFEPTGAPAAAGAGRDRRRWWALGVLVLVQFMLVLDITVVNVALPTIQRDLHFSHAGLTWVIDGYVLTAGGLLLLGGRLETCSAAVGCSSPGSSCSPSRRRSAAPLRARQCS